MTQSLPLSEQQWSADEPVLLTVRTMTYNHERYIAQCIEGVLKQRTTFRVRYVIHDDASTDGTAAIVNAYAARYPALIHPVCQSVNTYRHPERAALRQAAFDATIGVYVALCEGDDYWIDEHKLQQQVDIIAADDSLSLVRTASAVMVNDEIVGTMNNGGTRTFLFRVADVASPTVRLDLLYNFDMYITAVLATKGRTHTLPNVTAVWRKHTGGVWGGLLAVDPRRVAYNKLLTRLSIIENFIAARQTTPAEVQVVNAVKDLVDAYPECAKSWKVRLLFAICAFGKYPLKRYLRLLLSGQVGSPYSTPG